MRGGRTDVLPTSTGSSRAAVAQAMVWCNVAMLVLCLWQHLSWIRATAVWHGRRSSDLAAMVAVSWILQLVSYAISLIALVVCVIALVEVGRFAPPPSSWCCLSRPAHRPGAGRRPIVRAKPSRQIQPSEIARISYNTTGLETQPSPARAGLSVLAPLARGSRSNRLLRRRGATEERVAPLLLSTPARGPLGETSKPRWITPCCLLLARRSGSRRCARCRSPTRTRGRAWRAAGGRGRRPSGCPRSSRSPRRR